MIIRFFNYKCFFNILERNAEGTKKKLPEGSS